MNILDYLQSIIDEQKFKTLQKNIQNLLYNETPQTFRNVKI